MNPGRGDRVCPPDCGPVLQESGGAGVVGVELLISDRSEHPERAVAPGPVVEHLDPVEDLCRLAQRPSGAQWVSTRNWPLSTGAPPSSVSPMSWHRVGQTCRLCPELRHSRGRPCDVARLVDVDVGTGHTPRDASPLGRSADVTYLSGYPTVGGSAEDISTLLVWASAGVRGPDQVIGPHEQLEESIAMVCFRRIAIE